jgi:hypothetical protein
VIGLASGLAVLSLVGGPHIDTMVVTPAAVAIPVSETRRDSLPPDRWFGADKAQHALLSGATLAFSFAGLRSVGMHRRPALVAAGLPTAAVGLGKELRDRRVTGRFSVRDLAADAVGAALYAALLARTVR